MDQITILKGHIIYTDTSDRFQVLENGYIIAHDNIIKDVCEQLPQKYTEEEVIDYGNSLIIPGFYDLHNHAGQYLQCGTGMNKQLLEWLNDYTYNLEKDLHDEAYANIVYERYVNDLVRFGTLGACTFATSSPVGTACLFETFKEKGLRAYVGKVNMVRNAPDFIIEDVYDSIASTEDIIMKYKNEPLVKPIITPRFAPTSTSESLKMLGELALKHKIAVQSHLSENPAEIQWVQELYPSSENYTSVYDKHNLLGKTPTIMAHAVHLSDAEIELCKNDNVYLAHCPDSNINVRSGIAPVKSYLNKGLKVGLGSDIAGGHKIQMNEAIVRTIQSSKILSVYENHEHLTVAEAFYMATASGGSFFGKLGKLKAGYELDALVINDDILYKERYTLLDRLEKFLYIGDDRWITARYVAGKKIDVV